MTTNYQEGEEWRNGKLTSSSDGPITFLEQEAIWTNATNDDGYECHVSKNPTTLNYYDYGVRPSFTLEFGKKSLLIARCDDYGMALGKASEVSQKLPDRSKCTINGLVEDLLNSLSPIYTFNIIITQDCPTAIFEVLNIYSRVNEIRRNLINLQVEQTCKLITLKLDDYLLRHPLPISHFRLDKLQDLHLHMSHPLPPIHIRRNMNLRQFDVFLDNSFEDWLIPSENLSMNSTVHLSLSVTSTPLGVMYSKAQKSWRSYTLSLGVRSLIKLIENVDKILCGVQQFDIKISCSLQMDTFEEVVKEITLRCSHRFVNSSSRCFCGFSSSCQSYHYVFNDDVYRIFLHKDRANWLFIMSKIKTDSVLRYRMEQMSIFSSLDRQSLSLGLIEMWKAFYFYMSRKTNYTENEKCPEHYSQIDNETFVMKPTVRRCASCTLDERDVTDWSSWMSEGDHVQSHDIRKTSITEDRRLHPLRDNTTAEIGLMKKIISNRRFLTGRIDRIRFSYCRLIAFTRRISAARGNDVHLHVDQLSQTHRNALGESKTDIRVFFERNSQCHERFLLENIRVICQPVRRVTIDPFCFPSKIVRKILSSDLRYAMYPSAELVQLNFNELDGSQKELRVFEAFPVQLIELYDFASFHICRRYTPRRLTKFLEENPNLSDFWFIPLRPRSYNYLSIFVNASYPKTWFPQIRRMARALKLLEYIVFPIGQIMKNLPLLMKSVSYFYFEVDQIPNLHILSVLSQFLILNLKWEENTNIYSGFRRTFYRRIHDEVYVMIMEPTPKQFGQYRLFVHRKNEDFRILQYLRGNNTSTPPPRHRI